MRNDHSSLFPETWESPHLEEVSEVRYGLGQPPLQADDGVPMIRATNVKRGRISEEGLIRIKRSAIPESRNPYLKTGDVVVVRSGAYTGDVAMITEKWAGSVAGYDLVVSPGKCVDSAFCAYALLSSPVQRHFKGLSNRAAQAHLNRQQLQTTPIPLPPLPEQKKIAHILSMVQRAIEAQERLIQTTTELKKALMHKLFTEGLRNEPQKQTEIDLVPESWEVVELGTLFAKQPQNGIYKHRRDYGSGTQILRIDDFSNDGDVVTGARNLVTLVRSEIETYGLEPGDIVINRVNSLSHLGKTALIGEIADEMVFESNMMRFSVDESQVLKEYVFKFLNSPLTKKQIIGTAKRAVAQSSINQGDVRSIIVPKPSLEEQSEIVAALDATEAKIAQLTDKTAFLRDLFRTLLHELMTAKTRVHELSLSTPDA
jgi:type I restriction enzyme S subunit